MSNLIPTPTTPPAPYPVKRIVSTPTGHPPTDNLAKELETALNPVLTQLTGLPSGSSVLSMTVAPGWTGSNGLGYIQGLNGVTMLQGTLTYGAQAKTFAATLPVTPKYLRRFYQPGLIKASGELLLTTIGTDGKITVTQLDGSSPPTNLNEQVVLDGMMFVAGA